MAKTKKIDWLNHFLEFIVVIIGILIAFQLNTCREGRKEQNLVDRHVASVISETEFNKKNVLAVKVNSERILAQLDSIINYVEEEKDLQTIHELAMSLMSLDYTYIKKNAYNSLVETGDIRFIEDFTLQNDIIGLYEYYTWVEGIETASRETYSTQYFPYSVENFDLTTFKPQDMSVYNNKQFKNYLSVYRYSTVYRHQKQTDLLDQIDSFLNKYSSKK